MIPYDGVESLFIMSQSTNESQFKYSLFPQTEDYLSFSVLKLEEERIFITLKKEANSKLREDLYVSDETGTRFTKSIDNIFSFEQIGEGTYLVNKYEESTSVFKKAMISFNRGGSWHPLIVPAFDRSTENDSQCNDHDCSLHLRETQSSLGFILAVGNVGKHLQKNNTLHNTYLSRDGGIVWKEVINSRFI
jgi:hypothetical protein